MFFVLTCQIYKPQTKRNQIYLGINPQFDCCVATKENNNSNNHPHRQANFTIFRYYLLQSWRLSILTWCRIRCHRCRRRHVLWMPVVDSIKIEVVCLKCVNNTTVQRCEEMRKKKHNGTNIWDNLGHMKRHHIDRSNSFMMKHDRRNTA